MSNVADPRSASVFRFVSCDYEQATGIARLVYSIDEGPPLIEEITFPYAPWPSDASRQAAFLRALDLLHQVAGVSYWKTGLAPEMKMDSSELDAGRADFLGALYENGLAEFAYENRCDVASRINFEVSANIFPPPVLLDLPERALLAMGGGKDSLVSLELLREQGIEIQPFCVGDSKLIADTVRASGLPLLRIGRRLSPLLKAMNDQGAWNGHVPVTAINSCIGLCAAILYGYGQVVFSNEQSAEQATRTLSDGSGVNHQWSKSLLFETALRDEVSRCISPALQYFSLLRPWTELAIARRFSELTDYHAVFSSCNRNFHLDGSRNEGRWCGDCPKCRFTSLALAPFMPPTAVAAIVGKDLLGDPDQLDGFRELCELGAERPFECVGTTQECRAALVALGEDRHWNGHRVVRELLGEMPDDVPDMQSLMAASGGHHIPALLAERIGACG